MQARVVNSLMRAAMVVDLPPVSRYSTGLVRVGKSRTAWGIPALQTWECVWDEAQGGGGNPRCRNMTRSRLGAWGKSISSAPETVIALLGQLLATLQDWDSSPHRLRESVGRRP